MAILHAPEGKTAASDVLKAITQAIYDSGGAHKITKPIVCKPLYKKPGNKEPTNLRPIALQNSIAKIPSKMLATRLTNDLHRLNAINRANEGFLKHRSTGNVIATILNVWEDAQEHNKSCYSLRYDVSKAYDHLRWFTIRDGMNRLNLPRKFCDYVLGKMEGSTMEFKTHYGNTEPFEIRRGTAQGCPLSPLIYIISMDLMHAGLEANPLHNNEEYGYKLRGDEITIADKCYADDTFILSSSETGIRRMNQWVNAFCEHNYILMNKDKTKLFGLKKALPHQDRQDINITLPVIQHTPQGVTYSEVKSQPATTHIKHLGLWMNMHLDWSRAEGGPSVNHRMVQTPNQRQLTINRSGSVPRQQCTDAQTGIQNEVL